MPMMRGTNQNTDEWNDLTIKVYGSDANDSISDGGGPGIVLLLKVG